MVVCSNTVPTDVVDSGAAVDEGSIVVAGWVVGSLVVLGCVVGLVVVAAWVVGL